MNTIFIRAFFVALFTLSFTVQANGINVNDPWLRAAPPSAPALAVFMKLHNDSDQALALTSVKGDASLGKIELHRTTMENGMMVMTPQEFIPVAAQSSTVLKPGSWHIMLIKPTRVPKMGDMVELTLVFDNGTEQTISMPVRKGKKMMMHGKKMMHHKMMSK